MRENGVLHIGGILIWEFSFCFFLWVFIERGREVEGGVVTRKREKESGGGDGGGRVNKRRQRGKERRRREVT